MELKQILERKLFIQEYVDRQTEVTEQYNGRFNEIDDDIDRIKGRIKKCDEDVRNIMKHDLKEIKAELKNKSNTEEVLKLWKNFQNFAEYQDLRDLYSKVIPEIQRFEDKMQEMLNEQAKTSLIVKRFDEVLIEKASKQQIRELKLELEEYVREESMKDFKLECGVNFDKSEDALRKMENNLDILGQNISKHIYGAVKKATAHLNT